MEHGRVVCAVGDGEGTLEDTVAARQVKNLHALLQTTLRTVSLEYSYTSTYNTHLRT